jgi:putative ABC transport system substrate-binding protein
MDRRAFIGTVAGGLLAPALAAEAQQAGKVYRIGILSSSYSSQPFRTEPTWRNFQQGLSDLGWTEGRNLVIERRFAEGQRDRLPAVAQELVALNVDVIVAFGPLALRPAQEATRTIPIVMIGGTADPIQDGLVPSLARPGGNLTGVIWGAGHEVPGKILELLKEVLPRASRVTVLDEGFVTAKGDRALDVAARRLGLRVEWLQIKDPSELESPMAAIRRQGVDALYVPMTGPLFTNRGRVAAVALSHGLPTFGTLTEFPEAGGLLSYGQSIGDLFRRGAPFVDKILKGAKPGDIPIEQTTKFEVAVNLKTAKALGLTIPSAVLLRAGRVIE